MFFQRSICHCLVEESSLSLVELLEGTRPQGSPRRQEGPFHRAVFVDEISEEGLEQQLETKPPTFGKNTEMPVNLRSQT